MEECSKCNKRDVCKLVDEYKNISETIKNNINIDNSFELIIKCKHFDATYGRVTYYGEITPQTVKCPTCASYNILKAHEVASGGAILIDYKCRDCGTTFSKKLDGFASNKKGKKNYGK